MRIWVDADACPQAIKAILFRAAERVGVQLTLVANRPLYTPRSQFIRTLQVPHGFDRADHRIVELLEPGDLVVTGDVPLAAGVLARGGHALDPRGELFTEENMPERLAMRNLLDELRSTGLDTGGPSTPGKTERLAFANHLDSLLTRHCGGGAGT